MKPSYKPPTGTGLVPLRLSHRELLADKAGYQPVKLFEPIAEPDANMAYMM